MEWKTLSAVFAMLLLVFPAGLYAENSTAAAMCSGYTKLTIYQTMSSTNQHTFTLVDVSIENTPGTYSAVIDVSRSGQLMEELVVNPGSSASYSATDGTTYTVSVCSNSAGADGTKWAYVKVTPASAPVNHPPTFSSVSCPVTAKSVTCYVYASDPDADTVTYTINFGDNTGQVSGMQNVFAHTYQMAGTYTISIEAKDKYGASVGTALQVTVTGNENQKPIISSVSGPSTLSVNQKGTWTVSAYDPDGTYLSYTVNWGESTPSSSDSMGRIGSTSSFEHTYSKAGTYTITFGVKDAQGASAQSTASVMVGSSSAPTVDLKVNGMDEPSAVPFNGKFTVSWKSNGDYCAAGGHHVLLPNGSVWTEFYNLPASGSMTLIAAHKNYGYLTPLEIGIGCYKGTEGASDKVYVPVTATSTNTSTCPSYYSKISVGSGINVQSGGYQYTAKLIDISADSDGAAMIQVLDANDAVLAHAKVSPGITYVYSGSGTSSGANARLAVDVCKSPASSDRSYAMMFAQMTSLPGTDSCKGYPELYAGGELDRGTFRVKVKDVYTGQNIAASQRYATIEILDANDVSLKTTTIYPGAAYTYTQTGTSNSVTVKVCETAYGSAAGTKWAKVDAATSSGSSTNQPPVITGVSGPSSLAVNAVGTWKLSAYDPEGSYINVGISWGDGSIATNPVSGELMTFQHTYSASGTYTITFTVTDDKGAKTLSTLTVSVTGSSPSPAGALDLQVEQLLTDTYKYDGSSQISGPALRLTAYNGNKIVAKISATTYEADAMLAVLNSATHKYLYLVKMPGYDYYTSAQKFSIKDTSQFNVEELASDSYKYENSGIVTGVSLDFTAKTGYTVAAYTASGAKYQASRLLAVIDSQTDQFHHLFKQPSYDYYTTASKFYLAKASSEEKISLKFEKGWNMVSAQTNNYVAPQEIAKKCDISTTAYWYNPVTMQYVSAAQLGGGYMGYWMKANSACTYELPEPYYSPSGFPLKAGWNIIGAPTTATQISSFGGNCKITSGPWHYSPSVGQYVASSTLEPGKGYWVKVAADCTLESASDVPPSAPTN